MKEPTPTVDWDTDSPEQATVSPENQAVKSGRVIYGLDGTERVGLGRSFTPVRLELSLTPENGTGRLIHVHTRDPCRETKKPAKIFTGVPAVSHGGLLCPGTELFYRLLIFVRVSDLLVSVKSGVAVSVELPIITVLATVRAGRKRLVRTERVLTVC